MASIKVKFIGLVATVESVFCVILVEDKRSNLSTLLTIAVFRARPDLAVQRAAILIVNVPSPSGFVRGIGNNGPSQIKVVVQEAFGMTWAVDIGGLARRWRFGRLTGRSFGGSGWSFGGKQCRTKGQTKLDRR